MNRDFLKSLNLTDEDMEKILNQYGKDIAKYKTQADELEKLKNSLKMRDLKCCKIQLKIFTFFFKKRKK